MPGHRTALRARVVPRGALFLKGMDALGEGTVHMACDMVDQRYLFLATPVPMPAKTVCKKHMVLFRFQGRFDSMPLN